MNLKYYYEFRGLDNLLNRVEILTLETASSQEITPAGAPFTLSYSDNGKLSQIVGSGATLRFISKELFQFVNLHTDDMQSHLVKFYRGSSLYWVGWLDTELYNESLTDYVPYEVEFTASDFNTLDRIKYKKSDGTAYTDIVSVFDHLRRCLQLLNLPFNKLYLGCSTTTQGIGSGRDQENAFLSSCVMSSNFYDEDGEAMPCSEVVRSLLQPFGLTMVQKNANVYIVDYNTIHDGLSMRRYDFTTFSYEGSESVNWSNGDIQGNIYTSNGSYGYENMYNNVTITSSLYADTTTVEASVTEEKLSGETGTSNIPNEYEKTTYSVCEGWNHNQFVLYEDSYDTGNTIMGAIMSYTGNSTERNHITFETNDMLLFSEDSAIIRLKCSIYANTKENPFDDEEYEAPESTRRLRLFYKLLLIQEGNVVAYSKDRRWYDATSESDAEYGVLTFISSSGESGAIDSRVVNQWITNSMATRGNMDLDVIIRRGRDSQVGEMITSPTKSGKLRLIIDYAVIDDNKNTSLGGELSIFKEVKDLLLNDVSITIESIDGEQLSTDDYEFKSYINKQVKTDYEGITLKCISANEDKVPIGRANMLVKNSNGYEIVTAFTRAGQTDILERLLMCTIHSNYSQKNEKFGVTVKLNKNPILGYISYNSILDGSYLVVGAELDFKKSKATLSCVGYSQDTAKLSDIPYE